MKRFMSAIVFSAIASGMMASGALLMSSTELLAQDAQTSSVRRVVTGLDASGKAIVLFDTKETKPAATQQPVVRNFWTLNQIPAIASMQDDLGKAEVKANFGPGPQKILFRTVDFPPAPPDEIVKGMDVNMFMKIAGEEAPKKGRPPVHPFTHRTKTIDFAVVMSGEIDMVLDDSTVHLKAGDVVVQQETNHAWVNRGKEVCRISFVQIEATEP